ncbi:hypothetical protein BCR43DRAFT_446196 [Syncephalastrum racemosum]|uniref:Uncharacterized protein n=1 Tax=Syncephalastrum racemosum TaxID=13706 RepID=A0A1X2H2W6_SYNRA|nr:hypothetical protein BCR43DRAFT_446196 [Syncephalastrum racemosum]
MSSRKHRRDPSPESSSSRKKKKSRTDKVEERNVIAISQDDFYEKANEFRLWLKEEKGRLFADLDKDDTRHYFKKFVKQWNKNELDPKYYKGINSTQLASSDTTSYKWAFAKELDTNQQDRIRDSVDTMTGRRRPQPVGPARPDPADIEDVQDYERIARKTERKREKDRRERYLDEVAPKAEGREAQLLKRRAQNAYHKRERSPDVELNERDMYGGGDDFKAMLAAQKRREARQEERREERQRQRYGASTQERMAQMQAKEDATMAMLRQMAANRKAQGGL